MKIYQTPLCPDCVEALAALNAAKVPFTAVDITASTANLKEFLQLRDTLPAFAPVRAAGSIGVPCFLDDDGRFLGFDYAPFVKG